MAYKVLVLKGDGIGPEVVGEALQVLKVVARRDAVDLEFKEAVIGGHAIDAHGVPLPPNTLAAAKDSDAILLGAVGGPKWDNPKADVRPEQALLGLRKELGLFANLRPVKTVKELVPASPLRPEIIAGVDMVVIRELTGGIYYGKPSERREGRDGREAVDTCTYSAQEIERVLRYGFELARDRRKKLTSVDKANVLATSTLWRRTVTRLGADEPGLNLDHLYVDNAAMQIILRPEQFDVLLTSNLFGDILSDEGAALAGSIGMVPSWSAGSGPPLVEPIHGSAPQLVGKDMANPCGTILCISLLLRERFDLPQAAEMIEQALDGVLAEGIRTADVAEAGSTVVSGSEFTKRVRARIEKYGEAAQGA